MGIYSHFIFYDGQKIGKNRKNRYFFLGGVGEGGVSKRSKTQYLCVSFILFSSVLEKLPSFLKETR